MREMLPDSLGNIDALYDDLLNDDTFVQTKCYTEVLKNDNFIIVGRKGVGKTALARMIPVREEQNPRWSAVKLAWSPEVYFDDIAKDFNNIDALKAISTSEFMYQLWEHFIFENCMKIVLSKVCDSPYTGDESVVYEYLKSIGQADLDTIASMSKFFSGLVELISPSVEVGAISVTTGSGEKLKSFFDSKHNYSKAVDAMLRLMSSFDYKILYLIDDVDENITKSSSHNLVQDYVWQLIKVITDINKGVKGRVPKKHQGLLQVKAFVPTDVYSWLELRHTDKHRSNKYELRWSDDELRSMLGKRLAELCKLGNMPYEGIMRKYFGDRIYDPYGKPRDIFNYMIENTFGRPRDIMNLYRELKDVLTGETLSTDRAYQAISDYMVYTIDTIIKEYSFVQSDLEEILYSFDKADALCNYEYIRLRVASKDVAAVPLKDVKDVINRLYEIGLFGILCGDVINHSPPLHSLTVEYCYDRRRKPTQMMDFVMHPVFRYVYSMKDNSREYIKRIRERE